jgi:hypothetical protein
LDPAIESTFGSRQFAPIPDGSPVNSALALTVGDTVELGGKRFGYFGGLTYKNDYHFYDNGRVLKYTQRGAARDIDMADARRDRYVWGALVGLGFQPIENQGVQLQLMAVQA